MIIKIKIFLLCILFLPAFLGASEIAIIKSHNLSLYESVVKGIKFESQIPVKIFDMRNNREKAKEVVNSVKAGNFSMIITIGPTASILARRSLPDKPLIFSMIPTPIYLKSKALFENDKVTGVTLELPIKTQLKALQSIAPNTKKVGVMYNPKNTANIIKQANVDAKSLGIEIISSRLDDEEEVEEATTAFTGRVDAIWMIPDRTLLNKSSYNQLLSYTFKNKIPFFAFAEKMVEQGALVSLSADYYQLGRQLAKISNEVLFGGKSLSAFPISSPESLDLAVNLTSAKRIGVECNIALEVFTFAATKNFPIKVYK